MFVVSGSHFQSGDGQGAVEWEPLSRGSFPMYAAANSMVTTKCGAIVVGGREKPVAGSGGSPEPPEHLG